MLIPRSAFRGQTVHVDDDGLVDVLATATFNDNSDGDRGYFGLSNALSYRLPNAHYYL